MIKVQVFLGGGLVGVCLICLAVKLLTGLEAFAPPVKDFTLDGASIVQMLKVVGVSIVQLAVYDMQYQLFVQLIKWI